MQYDKDLTKYKFNKLTPLKLVGKNIRGIPIWECSCDCGNIKNILRSSLISNSTKSCGCLVKKPEGLKEKRTTHRCLNCETDFFVRPSRLKRSNYVFCSMSCKVEYFNTNKEANPCYKHRSDEKRFFDEKATRLKTAARKRKLYHDPKIDGSVLHNLWIQQGGLCYYSKVKMSLSSDDKLKLVSIDRINNSRGYEIDNIVLCSYIFNSFKFSFSMIEIFNLIKDLKSVPDDYLTSKIEELSETSRGEGGWGSSGS